MSSTLVESFSRLVLLATRQKALWQFSLHVRRQTIIQGDPYVTYGLVSKWRLVEWNAAFI